MVFSEIIQWLYPDRPVVPDLLFTLIPEVSWLKYLSDPLLSILLVLFVVYMVKYKKTKLPYFLYTIAFVYALKGLLIMLTPLGRPTGNLSSYGIFDVFDLKQHGMFPSGHTALSVILFLLIEKRESIGIKYSAAILVIMQVIILIVSRGHYSIDIVGGTMIAYIVFISMEKRKNRDWCNI